MTAGDVYVLLKGAAKSGLGTFHGIARSEEAAEAWEAGGANHWYHHFAGTDSPIMQREPITNPEFDNEEAE